MKKAKGGLKQKFIDVTKYAKPDFNDPKQVEIFNEIFVYMKRSTKGIRTAKKTDKQSKMIDVSKRPEVTPKFWDDLISYAKSIGIDLIGFTEVDEYFIFEEAVNFSYKIKDHVLDNAIVLGMEMKKERINEAPKPIAGLEAMRIYAELGDATNKLAQYLIDRGFRAQAMHPLGGPVLYPPMAQKAGLGEIGINGVLISPEFGPRQRLSMIATDASPLPEKKSQKFGIREYCKTCGACVKACPGQAILPFDKKIKSSDGKYLQNIIGDKCFPYFFKYHGCSICLKVCPFSNIGYEKIMKKKAP
ncbi:MAG: 4Fe-4S double cluster binding domain-containing protein [Candidatus Helarchaeota archaeon]